MKFFADKQIQLPEVAVIAGTRFLLGGGIGLLAAGVMNVNTRKTLGWTLFGIGALSSIPLAIDIFNRTNEGRQFGTKNAPAPEARVH